jgi:hypothetical protein
MTSWLSAADGTGGASAEGKRRETQPRGHA